jgi:hypothetical protein
MFDGLPVVKIRQVCFFEDAIIKNAKKREIK